MDLCCRVSCAAGHFEGTLVGEILDSVPELQAIAPNVLLALLWASLVCDLASTCFTPVTNPIHCNAYTKKSTKKTCTVCTGAASLVYQ